ncbi:MAG: hypothetical protein K8S98_06795 [Planctomycetes bacterium]|nr:hypothetical protein [Planctomycetota bacterium]
MATGSARLAEGTGPFGLGSARFGPRSFLTEATGFFVTRGVCFFAAMGRLARALRISGAREPASVSASRDP